MEKENGQRRYHPRSPPSTLPWACPTRTQRLAAAAVHTPWSAGTGQESNPHKPNYLQALAVPEHPSPRHRRGSWARRIYSFRWRLSYHWTVLGISAELITESSPTAYPHSSIFPELFGLGKPFEGRWTTQVFTYPVQAQTAKISAWPSALPRWHTLPRWGLAVPFHPPRSFNSLQL